MVSPDQFVTVFEFIQIEFLDYTGCLQGRSDRFWKGAATADQVASAKCGGCIRTEEGLTSIAKASPQYSTMIPTKVPTVVQKRPFQIVG